MKYSEAEKQIKELSSEYKINMGDGDFNLIYKGLVMGIFVKGHAQYAMTISDVKLLSKLPLSHKLYMILAELAATPLNMRKEEEKKHYVKIYDSVVGYLNIGVLTHKMSVDSKTNIDTMKTKFTDKDIEELKKRDDIPLDWNKVHFEDAE